ncbi:MAG: CRTAC1 family protein [Nanohaloarchaea archaeon SW_7_43_1]|nr:MAG: CRTAC1 family protein [Nanohaloarchaea archaeon SW_7_43_1]
MVSNDNSSQKNETSYEGFESQTNLIEDNREMRRYGLAAIESKGETKVFVTGFGGPNSLYRWKDGNLVDDTPENLKDPDDNAIGAAACDIDEDGQEELYVLTTGGQFGGKKSGTDKLYDRQGDSWVDLFEDSTVPNRYSGRSVACTYTPEGYAFFVARYGGPMQVITDTEDGLKDIAPRYGMDRETGGRSIVNLPTENGIDIFVGNERGPNFYYEQGPDGYEEKARSLGIADEALPARGATVYDKESDGDFDLAISNWNSPHKIYEKTTEGFKEVQTEEFSEPSPARNLVAADFNNNGETELFLNNIASRGEAENRFFDSKGNPLEIGEASEPQGLGTGATVTDIDEDGTLELILAHGEAGRQPLTMYKIPNNGDSVRLQPLSPSGASARNSYVKLEDGSVHVMDGGSAYLNQMEPWIHLGGKNLPLEVEVNYPNGTSTEVNITEKTQKIPHPETK